MKNNEVGQLLPLAAAPASDRATHAGALPLVWVLTCHREGDNAQTIGLAEALGWPFEVKRIVYKKLELIPNLLLRTTLAGMAERRSSPLEPPWPDLLIFAFRANENIARWIRAQAGGRTRLVVVGRPWSPLREFDLIVTTPQLRQPRRYNVLHNVLPLHRVTPERLAAAARVWAPRLAHLPRPCLAVLVGGTSGPYVFGRQAARRLGREASALSRRLGGSILLTTSARTSAAATRALWDAIDGPAYCHPWRSGEQNNPYFAFLALAHASIVTGDSISMITEASATGKPVLMFDFGGGPVAMRRSRSWRQWLDPYPATWLYALYMCLPRGRLNRTRDLTLVHEAIIESGRARWLGAEAGLPAAPSPSSDVARAVARIRALFADTAPNRHSIPLPSSRTSASPRHPVPSQPAGLNSEPKVSALYTLHRTIRAWTKAYWVRQGAEAEKEGYLGPNGSDRPPARSAASDHDPRDRPGESKSQLYDLIYGMRWGETSTNNYGFAPAFGQNPERFQLQMYAELHDLLRASGQPATGRLLEISCGRGGGLNHLVEMCKYQVDAVGLDFSMNAVAFCKARYVGPDDRFFVRGNALHLPFKDGVFDIVVNVEASSAYGDERAFFREVHRILRPKGRFLYADSRNRRSLSSS